MKTPPTHSKTDVTDGTWAPALKVARIIGCSHFAIHDWGKRGEYGYQQLGPRLYVVCVPEVVAFYSPRYPNIKINLEALDVLMKDATAFIMKKHGDAFMQHTA